MPNGECYVRNQLIGMKWIKNNFDVDIKTGWLVDTFGINAQIPQILNQFGLKHLLGNCFGGDLNEDIFYAKGLDGSKILVAGRDAHSRYIKSNHIFFQYVRSWDEIDQLFQKAGSIEGEGPYLIMPYTENEVVPSMHTVHNMNRESTKTQNYIFTTAKEYFDILESQDKEWPVFDGDLNPEFTGTFGQRTMIRLRNRKVETLLLEAEKYASLLEITDWQEEIEECWWKMAFNHSHDVFTGSHPTKVLNETLLNYNQVEKCALQVLDNAFDKELQNINTSKSKGILVSVFNSLPWRRNDVISISLPDKIDNICSVSNGKKEIPFEYVNGNLRFFATNMPACGFQNFQIELGKSKKPLIQKHEVEKAKIENKFISLECDEHGITKLIWKKTNKIILDHIDDFIVAQQDNGSFQIEEPVGAEITASCGTIKIFKYSNTLGQRLSLSGAFPKLPWIKKRNNLNWEIEFNLLPGKPRLDLTIRIKWQGKRTRIRCKFATNIDSSQGIYEIPFGTVSRKPYRVRSTAQGEWPAHRFATIEDQGHGLALINTGSAGVEINGGTIWTTLLRSPVAEYAGMVPDDTSDQNGNHNFYFSLVPYSGSLKGSKVMKMSQEVNQRVLTSINRNVQSKNFLKKSYINLEPETVVLSTVKKPEDGKDELIVRFYETTGQKVMSTLFVKDAKHAWVSNLSEEKLEEIKCLEGQIKVALNSFEIKTLRISRG